MDLGETKSQTQREDSGSLLFSAACSLILFGFVTSTAYFFRSDGPLLLPSGSYALVPGILFAAVGFLLSRKSGKPITFLPQGFALPLCIILLSDWFERSYNFFPDPSSRGDIIIAGAAFLLVPSRWRSTFLSIFAGIAIIALAATFLIESGGRLLFSDDNASFWLRLSLLKEKFPSIPFYYPYWNAGLDARDFFATGSLSGFLLFAPLIYLFPITSIYTLIIAGILFGLLPLSLWCAAHLSGLKRPAPAIAALLGVCIGLVWYRWALKFGTVGFTISAALSPLNLVLALRALSLRHPLSKALALFFVVTCSLMLLWSASALAFLPLGAVALLFISNRIRLGIRPLLPRTTIIAALLLVCLNLPWMIMFWSVSNVGAFLNKNQASSHSHTISPEEAPLPQEGTHRGFRHRDGELNRETVTKAVSIVREKAFSTNPLILFLALPGICLLLAGTRLGFVATTLWLILLGSLGVPLKPQLELDRMLLIVSFCLCIPTAQSVSALLMNSSKDWISILSKSVTAGFLLISPFCTASILSNRTVEQFFFASPLVTNLAEAIKKFGGDGRTVFSGCIVHELDEGHVAPLSVMSGKPLIASAPFHTLWKYTQVIPKSFMEKGDAGIVAYLDLMNATAVVAHEKVWREYFQARPDQYELVWRQGRFSLFRKLWSPHSYFQEGKGKLIEQAVDAVTVQVDSESALLKFNYFPFLKSSSCTITPARVAPEIELIQLRDCKPGSLVEIRSKGPWKRVLG